jgi:hypothetical protein
VGRKLALIIGNSEFEDGNLAQLVTPDADVSALAEILRDPEIGGFDDVAVQVNQPVTAVRRAIAAFFVERARDDLLLLYFSGHGIRDDRGQLFLAVKDTEHNLLRGTAIPAAYITDEMDNSRSRRQVLILDCCHSGAFSRGMKGTSGDSVGTAAAFEGTGSGRVVLTATDSTQYAWEGDRVVGQAENSVFTHYLIQGLRTGEPDTDADGEITLDELYNYVYEQVIRETPMQTPGKWSFGQQGGIVIARNPRPVVKPVELPADLQQTITDPRPWVREGAVHELDRILRSGHPGLALTASQALQRMATDDSRRVATAAAESLAAYAAAQPVKEIPGLETQTKPSESAVGERPADLLADSVPSTPEKAVQERPVQVEARPHAETITPAAAPVVLNWTPVLLTTLGLALVWGFGWVLSEANGWSGTAVDILWLVLDAVIGLIIGLVLQRVEPAITWKQILLITLGWVVASVIGGVVSSSLYGTANTALNGILQGAIGGLTTMLVLRLVNPSIHWIQILIVTLGWTIGWTIAHYYGPIVYNALDGAIGNSLGWWVIPGAVLAGVAAAIGSLVMFWQLGQLRRPSASRPS